MLAMTLAGSSPIPVRLQSEESEKRPGAPGPGVPALLRHPPSEVVGGGGFRLSSPLAARRRRPGRVPVPGAPRGLVGLRVEAPGSYGCP